jgi:hypothetical protein
MSDLVALVLAGVVALQVPIGVLMYLDARRLGLKNPERYWLGVVVPAGGFVVIFYYLSKRKSLPTEQPDGP